MPDTSAPAERRARAADTRKRATEEKRWRRVFLANLAETSNVAASARAANVPSTKAYDARRRDPTFFRAWQEALCEGYEHLEMSLLQRLREGEIKPAAGAKKGVRVFDNATALRLLAAHRDSVSRQQAIRGNEDAREIIAEVRARILKLRQPGTPLAITAQPDIVRSGDTPTSEGEHD